MTDLSGFDPNSAGNPNNNIFGLPFSEEEARLVIVPVPWEVTVSFGSGTARSAEQIMTASLQVDLFDPDVPDGWKQGYYLKETDKKVLLKSDYLRKEAELYIDYISKGDLVEKNSFMCRTLKEVNEGSYFLNNWVYHQTKELLDKGKLVALLGGDHSTPLGFIKAISEKHDAFGIIQIDAHCDLRDSYEGFVYSHASIMYNVLKEVPAVKKLVQVGIRDYSQGEYEFIQSNPRITTYFDRDIRTRQYEGETYKQVVEEMIGHLPQKVYISFDIDGLDPKLCPSTGTPVQGGFETEQVFYIFKKILDSGRQIIGFDLSEVSERGETGWDANVGARVLFKLCNLMVASNPE